jgi:tRNA U55 pseudouridine synthase TruB
MGNADAAMTALGTTIQQYNSILDEYQHIQFKYKDNATFQNIFKSEYASIVDFASFYFESDHNLRAAKQMVATMRNLNMQGMPKAVKDKETVLGDLRFIDNLTAEFRQKAKEGQYINTLIKDLETNILGQNFSSDIIALSAYPATTDKAEPLVQLREKAANTYCVLCKQEAMKAIKEYGDRLESHYRQEAKLKLDSTLRQTEPKLLLYSEQIRLVMGNLDSLYSDKEDAHFQLFNRKALEVKRDVDNLSDYLVFDIDGKSSDVIRGLTEKIEQTSLIIENGLEELRNYDSRLFEPIINIDFNENSVNKAIEAEQPQ